jgi:RNA methylase, spoU family
MDKKTIFDLGRDTVEQYRARRKLHLTMVLDNIRSLNNIGAIFRTCDAFLVDRIMLCGITATPPSDEIHKTALGAELSVEWEYFPTTMEAIGKLRSEDYKVCVLEQVKGSVELQEFRPEPDGRYAIVAGHEVHGVDAKVVNAADVCLEIPQFGTKHSLNVSVSAGIALWNFFSGMHR